MISIIIAHQTVIDGDAIGNDILGMYRTLKKEGYNVSIFADYYLGIFSSFKDDRARALKSIGNENSLVIYHHSISWENGEQFLSNCKGKIIFKYHNITPPEFFRDYSSIHYDKCRMGLEQTKRFIQQFETSIWYACSTFSSKDLMRSGLHPDFVAVLPPFNQLELLDAIEPDYSIINQLIKNRKNNILFTGRVAPNKGHVHLINIMKEYRERYDRNIHLWIIGAFDSSLQKYTGMLEKIIRDYDLQDTITFTGKLPLDSIKSYYLTCDEFLCMSEHEGFCVPVIEAQKCLLPVVTTGASALSETVGENQIVVKYNDYVFAAAALNTVYSDSGARKFCQSHGLMNVNTRFSNVIIRAQFLDGLRKVTREEAL